MTVTHYSDGTVRYIEDNQAIALGVIYCFTNTKSKKKFLKIAPLRIDFLGKVWLLERIEKDPLGQYTGIYTARS